MKFRFRLLINILCFFFCWMHLRWRRFSLTWKLGDALRCCHVFLQLCATHFTPPFFFLLPRRRGGLFCSNFTIFIFMNETLSRSRTQITHREITRYFYIFISVIHDSFPCAAQSSPRCIIIFLCFLLLLVLLLLHSSSQC